jgi:DNA-3-methyladenine glycosylase I
VAQHAHPAPGGRPTSDDGYFEELTRAVFGNGQGQQSLEAKWPGFRRAFSKFSVRAVADYTPDDVDRLMSDPEIVRNLQKIEATIENAAEILLIEIEHGGFREYCESFENAEALADDVASRFQQLSPAAAEQFIERVTGPAASAA